MKAVKAATLFALMAWGGAPAEAAELDRPALRGGATMDATRVATGAGELIDEVELRRRLEKADRAMALGYEARARKLYEAIVEDMTVAGQLPTDALWRLAMLHYAAGDRLEAAAILDSLATGAMEHGNLPVQVAALFEAARVYEVEGMVVESASRIDRGVQLLGSSELTSESRLALLKTVSR